ncbi:CsbD family protein [Streptococcus marimammalium]|uniref:CsbD family protein n=1 Tax=Streptococcus marimammalium TaxID=269666 RepID=UPI00036FAEC6|nr:CsbD family protein [Streptococcus marimammalium]
MSKEKLEGLFEQAKGSTKECIGNLTGDKKTEVEGAVEKVAGKAKEVAADVADKAKDLATDAKDAVEGVIDGLKK